jgi:hypothetical protein
MKTAFLFRCALPVLALCAACGSYPPYAAYAIEDDAELSSNIVVADKYLRDVIRVGRPLVERDAGTDNLRVRVPIRNIEYKPIQVLVQLEFRDRESRPLGDSTNRQVMTIPPGTTVNFQSVSVRSDAMDYVVRIGWNN